MTTYYVDPVNGADTNNGLGPDASAGTNKPWKTLAKLLGAAGFASGDTAYLAPGTYREVVTVSMTNPTGTTSIIGDPQNKQGFKDSSGIAVPGGSVIWSGFTSGDKALPSGTALLALNTRNFLYFQYILFIQGNTIAVSAAAQSTNISFIDCAFYYGYMLASNTVINVAGTAGGATAYNWLIDRCLFVAGRNTVIAITMTSAASGTGNNDVNFKVTNCVCISNGSFVATTGSANSGDKPGGVVVRNCTYFGNTSLLAIGQNWSTTVPSQCQNNLILSYATALSANASGQILEDYNIICAGTARTNVAIGTHSVADGSYATLFHFGQERIFGQFTRKFGEPVAGSPILGFGNDGNQTSYDERNNPRPAGGLSALPAAGALERSNTWGQETTTVRTGTYAISCIGPGYQDFLIPVDGTSTTVSVYLRYDSNYTGTLPKLQVLQNDELGLAGSSDTITAAANTWDQRSLTFTASKAGLVTVRLLSSDTSGFGRALADDFAVA